MATVTKHYIEYHSPGTLFDETSTVGVSLAELTIEAAVAKGVDIIERHGARPYGFHLVTSVHEETKQNGKTLKSEPEFTKSGLHYLEGKVLTLDDIPDDRANSILRDNMRCNDWPVVVRTTNSYKHTGALNAEDVVLKGTEIIARGSDYGG